MKKVIIVFAGVIFGLTILSVRLEAAEKFAYVELRKLFNEYSKTKNYDKELSDKENAYTQEREKRVNEIKQFQDKMNLLSDKEKEAKTKELEAKVKTLQDFDRDRQTDLRKESDEKRAEIMKDIETAIKQFAEKEGYALVFNEVGVAYNVKSWDVTDKIIYILNKGDKK